MNIKDYIHLYLGCEGEAQTLMANYEWYVKRQDTLTPKMLDGVHRKVNQFKPILRPLNDITKDEAKECGIEWVEYRGEEFGSFDPKEFVYLLSKHFDLFGLIEAGLAIDKTTLK